MTEEERKSKTFELIYDESFRSMVATIAAKMGMTQQEWKEMRNEMFMRIAVLMVDMSELFTLEELVEITQEYKKGLA